MDTIRDLKTKGFKVIAYEDGAEGWPIGTKCLPLLAGAVQLLDNSREHGISEQTFYNWKRKYGGMGVSELRRLRLLEEENRKLKQLVADLTLDKHILQEVVKKKI